MQLTPVFRELHSRLKFKKTLSRICKPSATRNNQDQEDPTQIKHLTFWKWSLNSTMPKYLTTFLPGREFNSFPGFIDFFSRIKVVDLHAWITENRERLSYEVLS